MVSTFDMDMLTTAQGVDDNLIKYVESVLKYVKKWKVPRDLNI